MSVDRQQDLGRDPFSRAIDLGRQAIPYVTHALREYGPPVLATAGVIFAAKELSLGALPRLRPLRNNHKPKTRSAPTEPSIRENAKPPASENKKRPRGNGSYSTRNYLIRSQADGATSAIRKRKKGFWTKLFGG